MPALARVYHVPPVQQRSLTWQEFRDLEADYKRLQLEEGEDGY